MNFKGHYDQRPLDFYFICNLKSGKATARYVSCTIL